MQPPAELNGQLSQSSARSGHSGRVVLIGATVRAAAQSARRAGWRVIGVDLFGDLDAQQSCEEHFVIGGDVDCDQILEACRGISVIQVGGLAGYEPLLRRIANACPLRGQPGAWSQLRDAARLREFAETAGMRFPCTLAPSSYGETRPSGLGSRWLVKRRDSCGGLGVRWAGGGPFDPLRELIQAWIPGRVFGATFLSNGHSVGLLGVCRSLYTRHGGRPFVFAGCFGPIPVRSEISRLLKRLAQQVMVATSVRGLFNVDFVVDPSGAVWLLEINPRWSASSELIERRLIDQGSIQSLFARLLEALDGVGDLRSLARDDRPGRWNERGSVYLKRVLFARRDTRFEPIRLTSRFRGGESIHDVPPGGTIIRRGDPICTVITPVDCSAAEPLGPYRRLLRDLNAAMPGC